MTHPAADPKSQRAEVSLTALRWAGRVRWLLVLLSLAAACFAWAAYFTPRSSEGAAARYVCPMHPQVVSSDPGECPICHMALELVRETPPVPGTTSASPSVTLPRVGSAASAPSDNAAPAGLAALDIGFERAQAIGVRTAVAERARSTSALRVTATVSATEAATAEVRARASGFIEKLLVSERGGRVQKGQTLALLYSPEIYQTFSDYVLATEWAKADAPSERMRRAVRRRLSLLGVSAAAIEQAESSREVPRTVALTASIAGYVVEKHVTLGSYVTPELVLYQIVDLDRVFVIADVPSGDLSSITRGQKAKFFPSGRPGLSLDTEVDQVAPIVRETTRTFEVRLRIDNRELGLLPGEFGALELMVPQRDAVWVPKDAIVDTGLDRYAFVEVGRGRYEPRTLELGEATAGRVEVRRGVKEGERVVSGAAFLIDSESRLRAALSGGAPSPEPQRAP
jgi:Cu(I)/Ag(I) efflux system membrane fusion protein